MTIYIIAPRPLFGTKRYKRFFLCFLSAKSTENSPANTSAYGVCPNAGSGRLFAGLWRNCVSPLRQPQAAGASKPAPSLALLERTPFNGSGIEPGTFFTNNRNAACEETRSGPPPPEAAARAILRIVSFTGNHSLCFLRTESTKPDRLKRFRKMRSERSREP